MKTSLPMLEEEARRVAGLIDGATPADVGFTLLLFNYGEEGDVGNFTTYMSSADRETMREVLRDLLAKWDADDFPEAPVKVPVTKARRKWKFGR